MSGGLKLVGLGIVIGLGGAFVLTRVLDSLLFGVTAHDPLVFAGNAVLLDAHRRGGVPGPGASSHAREPSRRAAGGVASRDAGSGTRNARVVTHQLASRIPLRIPDTAYLIPSFHPTITPFDILTEQGAFY